MSKFVDMTGWIMSEHGVPESRLTVLQRTENSKRGDAQWLCECSCLAHKKMVVSGTNLRCGNTLSCGCLRKEKALSVSQQNRKINIYDLSGEYGIGWTNNTNEEFYFDLEDYDKIKDYAWHKDQRGYVMSSKKKIGMHQLLYGKYCDHIDRNKMNNRKSNLRDSTHTENMQNRSVFKNNKSGVTGVYYDKRKEGWCVQITKDKKQKYLGCFSDKEIAIKVRLEAEAKYFGDFAPQRHLFEQYGITSQNDLGQEYLNDIKEWLQKEPVSIEEAKQYFLKLGYTEEEAMAYAEGANIYI